MADDSNNKTQRLYNKFLELFPNFKPMVRAYYPHDNDSIKIYTKQHKSFIFKLTKDSFSLKNE